MGANGSSEHDPRHRRSPNKHKGQDVVRGAKVQYISENVACQHISNNLDTILDESLGTAQDFENKDHHYDNNPHTSHQKFADNDDLTPELPAKAKYENSVAVKQIQHPTSGSPSVSRLPRHSVDETNQCSGRTANKFPYIGRQRSQSDHNPQMMTSTAPDNMNTIKHAKVNVRDKINFFKTEHPEAGVRTSTADAHDLKIHGRPVPIHLPPKPDTRRKTHVPIRDMETASTGANSSRRFSAYTQKETTPSDALLAEIDSEERHPQPSNRQGCTNKPILSRMDTLEAFNKLKEDHAILNKFEKAKPAARRPRKKVNASRASAFEPEADDIYHARRLPRNGVASMYGPPGQFGSDPDLVKDVQRARMDSQSSDDLERRVQDDLADLHKRTGKKYAMDDTAYETLSRRKKLAGQRHALAVTDRDTEKNFLLSLKRNLHFKMKAHEDGSGTTRGDGQSSRLPEMVF